MSVINRSAQRIDLSNQRGALTSDVLQYVRDAMRLNDYFIHLSLSDNVLGDEELAMISAIVKEKASLESLEACNCNLTNKSINFYLFPALMLHRSVKKLDLSKNAHLTDEVAEALASYIANSELTEINLMGVPLTRVGGAKIVEAMQESNSTLMKCQLPYTVGYNNLDKAAMVLERNWSLTRMHHTLTAITPTYNILEQQKREEQKQQQQQKKNKKKRGLYNHKGNKCFNMLQGKSCNATFMSSAAETISWGKYDDNDDFDKKVKRADNINASHEWLSKEKPNNIKDNYERQQVNANRRLISNRTITEGHGAKQLSHEHLLLFQSPEIMQKENKCNELALVTYSEGTKNNMRYHYLPPIAHFLHNPEWYATNSGNLTSNSIMGINKEKDSNHIRALALWADPALQCTLLELQTLHERCALYDSAKSEQQRRLAYNQGLITSKHKSEKIRNANNNFNTTIQMKRLKHNNRKLIALSK